MLLHIQIPWLTYFLSVNCHENYQHNFQDEDQTQEKGVLKRYINHFILNVHSRNLSCRENSLSSLYLLRQEECEIPWWFHNIQESWSRRWKHPEQSIHIQAVRLRLLIRTPKNVKQIKTGFIWMGPKLKLSTTTGDFSQQLTLIVLWSANFSSVTTDE